MKLKELFEGDVIDLARFKRDQGIPGRRTIKDLAEILHSSSEGDVWHETMQALRAVRQELSERGIETQGYPSAHPVENSIWTEELPYTHLEDLQKFEKFLVKRANATIDSF